MKPTAPSRSRDGDAPTRVIENATVNAVLEHGHTFLAIARRHSADPIDADDAFQRSVEILMTKAPNDDVDKLVHWMAVVVRNEARAIARLRLGSRTTPLDEIETSVRSDLIEPEEYLNRAVNRDNRIEAIRGVNHQEMRCLLLRAENLSYAEIVARTGFTTRKVERVLAKGRRRLSKKVESIEAGTECERVERLLSLAADGNAEALRESRPHLRNCGGCREMLREYKQAPQRISAAIPLGIIPAEQGVNELVGGIHQFAGHAYERFAAHVYTAQQWLELGGFKKAAVVVASTTAIAGGGVVAGGMLRGNDAEPRPERATPAQLSVSDATKAAGRPV